MMNANKNEVCLRRHLGIPGDAEHVLIFAESSHWDSNWLLTSEEYFRRFVRRSLDFAVEELMRDPRCGVQSGCDETPNQEDELFEVLEALVD